MINHDNIIYFFQRTLLNKVSLHTYHFKQLHNYEKCGLVQNTMHFLHKASQLQNGEYCPEEERGQKIEVDRSGGGL